MKVFNSTLAAIGLAAFVFASCSDNTSDPTGNQSPAKVDATTLDLTNSGESLFSSVINYKNSTPNARKFFGTRAASDANFVTDLNKDEESTIPVQPATATQALGNDNLNSSKSRSIRISFELTFKSIVHDLSVSLLPESCSAKNSARAIKAVAITKNGLNIDLAAKIQKITITTIYPARFPI